MSFRESVVMRLIGLFIFLAPKRGANFLADVTVRVNEKIAKERA